MSEIIKPCPKCGKQPKVRYKMPYTWVECKNKCMRTGVYPDWDEQNDPEARRKAIAEWNKMEVKNG